MRLSELSEIVAGLMIGGALPLNSIEPSKLEFPHDGIIKDLQNGKDMDEIRIEYGWQPVQTALVAAESFTANQTLEKETLLSLVSELNKVHSRYKMGKLLGDSSKMLMEGKWIDPYEIIESVRDLDEGKVDFRTMQDVEAIEIKWIPTNVPYIDEHVGGQNPDSLNLIAASPGTGKTSTLLDIMAASMRLGKKVALLSLELSAEVAKRRLMEIAPDLTDDEMKNLIVFDGELSALNLQPTVSRLVYTHPDIEFIGIDYIEMLIPSNVEETAGLTGMVYRILQKTAKIHKVIIWALCQFSRSAYTGGIPRVNHIRYSGLAEASAAVILMLYKQNNVLSGAPINSNQRQELPRYPEGGYVIVGKSRFGYKYDGVGAIQLPWDSETGVWERGAVGQWTEINI